MKVYFDLSKKALKSVDLENQTIYTGDLVSTLEVISNQVATNEYVLLSAKLPNAREVGPYLFDGLRADDTTNNTSTWTFTLSRQNGFTLVAGNTTFYLWLIKGNEKKCIGAVNVNVEHATAVGDYSYFVDVDDSDVDDTLANMAAQIDQCMNAVSLATTAISTLGTTKVDKESTTGKIYNDSTHKVYLENNYNDTVSKIKLDNNVKVSSQYGNNATILGMDTSKAILTASDGSNYFQAKVFKDKAVVSKETTDILVVDNSGIYYKGNNLAEVNTSDIIDKAVTRAKLSQELQDFLHDIPRSMVFKGSLGVGGTITELPEASEYNDGYTYKVITAGTYQNLSCDVGDLVVSNGSVWVLIPSGDDKPDEYIVYVHASYNEQTGKEEYSIVGTPDFPFLVDDETRISNVKEALEGIKVLLYIDTETNTGSGEPWNVVELTLNRIYHSDDGLVTEAYFVSPYIQNYIYEHGNKLIQFEICYDQEGLSDGGLENVTQTTYLKYTEKSLNYYTKPETENYVQNKFNQYIFNVDIRDEEIYDHDDFSRLFMGINDKDSKELDSFKVRIIFGTQYLADVFHSILPLVSIDQVDTTVTYTFQNDDYYVIVTQSGFSDETFTITWGETTAPYYSKSATDTMLAAKEDKANKVTSISSSSTNQQYPSAKAVYDLIEALPEPMLFKGTLGTNGTITTLPAASSSNEGFTYKVIENGTYASQQAAVGDVFVSNGSEWVLIPSGDEAVVSDTWRTIQVNGTDLLGNGIGTGKANFKSGSGISVTGSGNDITFTLAELLYSATKTYAANQVALYNGYFFLSLVDNNTGNTPDSTQDTAYWARVFV